MQRGKDVRLSGKRIVLLIVTALTVVFIFGQSFLPKRVSTGESGWVEDSILDPIFRFFGMEPPDDHIVRKIAHIAEFAVLSVLLVFCFRGQIARSAGVAFCTAFLDESIQLLTDRGALISDVWIDLIGIAIGTLIGFLLLKAIRGRHKKTKENGSV